MKVLRASLADAYVIIPDSPFAYDGQCTAAVLADEMSDSDGFTLTVNYHTPAAAVFPMILPMPVPVGMVDFSDTAVRPKPVCRQAIGRVATLLLNRYRVG
ncbi:MAG: hypothetical protein BroJett015_23030 [Chloroflexota bacterium]|nr:hypothetical protein [Ardenticatenaceae bacterium]GIK56640.1 MAG: hypothetical protein BroJett015_23030 [Chloroflexota bacterium]